jgi:hypothetical protein
MITPSMIRAGCGCGDAFAAVIGFARDGVPPRGAARGNFPPAAGVVGGVMLTGAIVFGMVGVAAGFTWDYFVSRDK